MSCATSSTEKDLSMQDYVDEYTAEVVAAGCPEPYLDHISYGIVELDENVMGRCILRPTGRRIEMNSLYWHDLNADEKYQLTAHELEHCIFRTGKHYDGSYHYMSSGFYSLPKSVIDFQIRESLNERCKRWRGR